MTVSSWHDILQKRPIIPVKETYNSLISLYLVISWLSHHHTTHHDSSKLTVTRREIMMSRLITTRLRLNRSRLIMTESWWVDWVMMSRLITTRLKLNRNRRELVFVDLWCQVLIFVDLTRHLLSTNHINLENINDDALNPTLQKKKKKVTCRRKAGKGRNLMWWWRRLLCGGTLKSLRETLGLVLECRVLF